MYLDVGPSTVGLYVRHSCACIGVLYVFISFMNISAFPVYMKININVTILIAGVFFT